MHPHSSAVLREMSIQRENALHRAELARQMEFAHQPELADRPSWRSHALGRLIERLPHRWDRSTRPLEPSNS